MKTVLVVTVIGPDRPGIVSGLSKIVAAHDADWLESHLGYLVGQFAGMVHLEVADSQVEALTKALTGFDVAGMQVSIARGSIAQDNAAARRVLLELTGLDHPGIVRDITSTLKEAGVSVETFESEQYSGSMSGEPMFKATARLLVPNELPDDALDAAMQSVSHGLMVDLDLLPVKG
ncbi:MAG: ACT domain-containing protein [Granulosicoccus sp.]